MKLRRFAPEVEGIRMRLGIEYNLIPTISNFNFVLTSF